MKRIFSLGNLLIAVLIIISSVVWHRVYETYRFAKSQPQELRVTFLDVGQGDGIFITTPLRKSILIDAGKCSSKWSKFDAGRNVVIPYIRKCGIKKLDLVIATHPDSDHIGGLLSVLKSIPADTLLDSGTISTTKTYEKLLTLVGKKHIKYKILKHQAIHLEPDISLQVLSPISKSFINDSNNNCIVMKLIYGNISFLFTCDIIKAAELLYVKKYADQLKCTILKVAHHGSKYSSCSEFLNYAKPDIAVISVSKNNPYGHPSKEAIKRIRKTGARIYRTDKSGSILITTDGKTYKVFTIE